MSKIPLFFLFFGSVIFLASHFGEIQILSQNAIVPPNSYLAWDITPSVGVTLHISVTLLEDNLTSENELEVYIIDDTDFSSYVTNDFHDLSIPPRQREFIGKGSPGIITFRIPFRSEWHIVLNNKVRVTNRDVSKLVNVHAHMSQPYSFLRTPGMVLVLIGGFLYLYRSPRITSKFNR